MEAEAQNRTLAESGKGARPRIPILTIAPLKEVDSSQ